MTDYVFIQNFRFNKDQVHRLVSLLGLDANDNPETRGNPLTPFLQVCIALLTFAGDNRQRISGLCGGISQFAARKSIIKVTNAILTLRQRFLRMPSAREKQEVAADMMDRFGLPGFAYGVDGMVAVFNAKPRSIPPGTPAQTYWTRDIFFQITPTPKLFIAFIILKLTNNPKSIIFQTSNITVINLNNILLQEAEVCHKCTSNWKRQPHLRC